MKEKIKFIYIGILVGIIAFPTITLGGSFVSSLIVGKTPAEAVQILAEQIDSLIGKVDVLETKQVDQAQITQGIQEQLEKEKACRKAEEFFNQAEYVYSQGSNRIITALTVNDFIFQTQRMLQEYQQLAEKQNILCPEGVKKHTGGIVEEEDQDPCEGVGDMNKEVLEQQAKLIQLQELNTEYLLVKSECEE